MDRRRLGSTSIDVPAIGMGTWRTFDTDEDSGPLVELAIESGINLFDSSPMYGRAERTLARALEGVRDRVLVATKVWTAAADEGRQQADFALRLFGRVDIYQVHNLLNVPAQLALLERLKSEGKVGAVGATHYQESAFRDLATLMKTKRLDMVQIPYNPLRRTAERELLPMAEALGIAVTAYGVFSRGLLTGSKPSGAGDFRAHLPRFAGENGQKNMRLVDTLATIAKERGVAPAQQAFVPCPRALDRCRRRPGREDPRCARRPAWCRARTPPKPRRPPARPPAP